MKILVLLLLSNFAWADISKVATDTSVIIMCDGKATEVIYGLHLKRGTGLFASTIEGYIWIEGRWLALGFEVLEFSGEGITTDPERITLQLSRWVKRVNTALDAQCGSTFPDDAETVMRNIIANRISVIDYRFVLSD